jgi:hypothetical protein
MLDDGVYTSVSEIGEIESISKSYVSRILRLALLVPDIIEMILEGRSDQALMLEQLERPLWMDWSEQGAFLSSSVRCWPVFPSYLVEPDVRLAWSPALIGCSDDQASGIG